MELLFGVGIGFILGVFFLLIVKKKRGVKGETADKLEITTQEIEVPSSANIQADTGAIPHKENDSLTDTASILNESLVEILFDDDALNIVETIESIDDELPTTPLTPTLLEDVILDGQAEEELFFPKDSDSEHDVEIRGNSALLKDLLIPIEYLAVVNLLRTSIKDDIAVFELYRLTRAELIEIKHIGIGKLEKIKKLRDWIEYEGGHVIDAAKYNSSTAYEDLAKQNKFSNLFVDEIENILLKDLNNYVNGLAPRDNYIFTSRHGIGKHPMTLEAIGKSIDGVTVTRERIRQLQKGLDQNWSAFHHIEQKTLWNNVSEHLSLLRPAIFSTLKNKFYDEKGFFEFLELTCNVKPKSITKLIFPSVPAGILKEFWLHNQSPASLDTVTQFLIAETGAEQAVADNMLSCLEGKERAIILQQKVSPILLSKSEAITHKLLEMKSGAPWEDIHQRVNDSGVCRSVLSVKRMDGGLQGAVDNGWIYQSGRGQYRHLDFLETNEITKEEILDLVQLELKRNKERGRNSINLMTDFYQQNNLDEDYFSVRHLVKSFGESKGIFFNGKSGADTVSLDEEFSLISQEEALLELFMVSKKPLTTQDIASVIRSKSLGHASYYLESLMRRGNVVRVSEMTYEWVDNAYKSINVTDVIKCAENLISNESRAIEAGIMARYINRELGMMNNKYFYLSLLKLQADSFNHKWYFSHNLISKNEMTFDSLTGLVRALNENNYLDRSELFELIKKYVLVDDRTIKGVIGQAY